MSYQTLYRKYRPKTLNEVYGQNVITRILTNAIQSDKFAHAYLFTGPRGCGKTSVAKIVARMVNCTNLKNGEPCNKCENCLESIQESCVDIIEIDAASNNGVDEIRELKNNVSILPSYLKYKVYIIDEVHMLSTGAFNALLKTLEEPPEHVIFILATTDLEKVPITIISRCQTLEFKKINNKDMFDRLSDISKKEKIKITDDALYEIIDESDGGLRDAVGLLDLAQSYTSEEITVDDISTINGNISINEIEHISKEIISFNIKNVIDKINEYKCGGKDLIKLTEKIIKYLNLEIINNNNINIRSIYEELLTALYNMKRSNLDNDYLMLALYKIDLMNTNKFNEEIDKIEHTDIKTTDENIPTKVDEIDVIDDTLKNINKTIKNIKEVRVNNTFVSADKNVLKTIKDKWADLDSYTLDRRFGAYVCELIDVNPVVASKDYLVLSHKYDSFVDKGNSNVFEYEKTIKKILNESFKIVFITDQDWKKYKQEYIDNTKNGHKYEIITEEFETIDNNNSNDEQEDDIIIKANEIFNDLKIEIEE